MWEEKRLCSSHLEKSQESFSADISIFHRNSMEIMTETLYTIVDGVVVRRIP